MKAICIIGSPQSNGSTATIVDKIIEGMEISGIRVNRIVLGQKNIQVPNGLSLYGMKPTANLMK